MISNLAGLLLANACFLAAGAGVTALAGWWRGRRALVASLGLSYLCGVATYGVSAQLLYVLGASLARWQVILVCALPACGVVRGLGRAPGFQRAPRTRFDLLAVPIAAMLALLALDLWYQPLWAYDSWTFWTPKAHALYALNGLHASWFTAADLANKDYPILLPALEAAGFRFTGYETALLDVQSWLVFAAFVRAVYEICAPRARPVVLWAMLAMLVFAPSVADQLAAAEADIPVAALFAASGLCACVWLVEQRRSGLVLASVLAAGAAATKVEGFIFAVSLFAVLAVVSSFDSRRRAGEALGAGAAALGAGYLPWRLWMLHEGIASQASFGRLTGASFLVDHASRVPLATGYMLVKLLDPRAWLLLLPMAVLGAVAAARRGQGRRRVLFVSATVVVAFLGLLLAYWSTPLPFHDHLATSARRVITGIVFFCAALTPMLAGDG